MLGWVNVPGKAECCYSSMWKEAKRGVECDGERQGCNQQPAPLQDMFG